MRKTWAVFSLGLVTLVTAYFGFILPDTQFDYDFDTFFKPDDAATQYFKHHRETFGTDNDFILIGLVSQSGVFNSGFLNNVDSLTEKLEALPLVKRVVSPGNLFYPVRAPLIGTIFQKRVLSGKREADSLRVFRDPSLTGNIFSTDTTAISLVVTTDPGLSKSKSDQISASIHRVTEEFDFDGVHLAGRAIGQVVYVHKIQTEFGIFMGISLLFIVLLLLVTFRSFRGILLPLATVLIAVVWAIGLLTLSGKGISILLNMLPPIIFVVGMSDAIHLYSRYLEELRKGESREVAIRRMVFQTGKAAFYTSLTTAIGFASLYFTGIPALQDFGIFTAAGVMSAYAVAILLMPSWLRLTPVPRKSIARSEGNWEQFLQRLYTVVVERRKTISVGAVVLTILLAGVVSQIKLNSFILDDLRPDEPLRKDFAFFETYFSGVRPFEMGVKLRDSAGTLLDRKHLLALNEIEQMLRTDYDVHAIQSPVAVIKAVNRMDHNGDNHYYRLPGTEREWRKAERTVNTALKSGKLHSVLTDDGRYASISGRTSDYGSRYFESANARLMDFIDTQQYDREMEFEITGTGTLIDRTNQNLVSSLGKGLGTAFLLIAVVMGLLFKSVKMALIALIPNLLPLLALGAVMTLAGIALKMSTSIIFTIAFGIAVDDTIHILSRYRLESRSGTTETAFKRAFIHTGKSVILTSIILLGGFISLCFSSFQSTFYIGLLVSLTLIFALLFDLCLLPVLIVKDGPSLRNKIF